MLTAAAGASCRSRSCCAVCAGGRPRFRGRRGWTIPAGRRGSSVPSACACVIRVPLTRCRRRRLCRSVGRALRAAETRGRIATRVASCRRFCTASREPIRSCRTEPQASETPSVLVAVDADHQEGDEQDESGRAEPYSVVGGRS